MEFYTHRILEFCDSIKLLDWRALPAPQRSPVRIVFSPSCTGCLREFVVAAGILQNLSLTEKIDLFVGGVLWLRG